MKISIRKTAMALLGLLLPAVAMAVLPKDVENVHVADRTRYVTDMAGALSPRAKAMADSILADAWRQSSAEPVVVIVPDLSDIDADTYATELFTQWGIGKKDKDNGVLMLISIGDRRAVIRTGYGAEGVLPDVIASRIIRGDLTPAFRRGDYDAGVLAALQTMHACITNPEARAELQSAIANDAAATSGASGTDMFHVYLTLCGVAGVAMLLLFLYRYAATRKEPTARRFAALQQWQVAALAAVFVTLGAALPAYIVLILLMRHVRLHKRLCPHCHTRMERVDEVNDNRYLTPAQDAEERLDSVDYDVWLCPSCGETDIIPYINKQKNYSVCPNCGARACVCTGHRVLMRPTTTREGHGVTTYRCLNCGNQTQKPYNIAKVAAPPVVIVPGGIGRGGGFGGGFGGGSFGGGATGGGGASGGW